MQRFLGLVALASALAPTPRAVRIHVQRNFTPAVLYGSEHVQNLAGEGFSVGQPGDYELLRMPVDKANSSLIDLRGTFVAAEGDPCVLYMETFTLNGEWLGGKVLHVKAVNGSVLAVKVSSKRPPQAGHVRGFDDFEAADNGLEALPDTCKITKSVDTTAFQFHVGPKKLHKRPTIAVALTGGPHGAGLNVTLINMQRLDTPQVAGLLGTEKRDPRVDLPSEECKDSRLEKTLRKKRKESAAPGVDKHIWNLAGEPFDVISPGDYELLRIPTNTSLPTLIDLRGTFVAANHSPCYFIMETLTINGEWLGGKVVHMTTANGLSIKVSSKKRPIFAGKYTPIVNFTAARRGREAIPRTIRIDRVYGPALEFRVGRHRLRNRPIIRIGQGLHEGLDLSLFNARHFDEPELAGLLGTNARNGTVEAGSVPCVASGMGHQ